jgi:hypothetical protein
MTDLSISIVNHNNRDLLEPLLKSIIARTRALSYEIYVVDNASTDNSVKMMRKQFPQVNLIRNKHSKGFATNHNMVLKRAQGRYVILLNDDMLLANNALDRMVAFMDSHPEAGAIGCKLLNPDGSLQRSAWIGFPSPRALFIDLFYLSVLLPGLEWVKQSEAVLHDSGRYLEVDHILGACLLTRREIIEQVGLLDESFFLFLEETDWCYRIKQQGWKVYWIPEGEIIHYGQQSISGNAQRFVPMRYRNYCRFCRKHGSSVSEILAMKVIIALGSCLRAGVWGYRGLTGQPSGYAMMKGYLHSLYEVWSF